MRNRGVLLLLVLLAPLRCLAQGESPEQWLTVEALECRGNKSTSCDFILGHLYLSVGDRLDEGEIENAKLRLSWLRNFESVSIYLEKGSQKGRARVVVEVAEASPVVTGATLGVFSQMSSVGQLLAAHAGHNNLFGNGKALDLNATVVTSFDGPTQRLFSAGIQYADPHLFGTRRNFLTAGVSYVDLDLERRNGDVLDLELLGLGASLGRRLWDFSYVTVGFQYRPVANLFERHRDDDGRFETDTQMSRTFLVYSYGWNSEDNPDFPTRGSALSFTLFSPQGDTDDDGTFSYRTTWRSGANDIWKASFGVPVFFSLEHSRPFRRALESKQVANARRFVSFDVRHFGRDEEGRLIKELGLRAGVRFDARSLGIVELFVFGSTDWTQ